jgi:hypothetical protein
LKYLDTGICSVKRDLKDSNGNYLKSVCTVYQDKTYNDAAKFCAANNMTLYVAGSIDEKNALLEYSNIQWPFGTFWIEGNVTNYVNCSVVTNDIRILYDKAENPCIKLNYFNCEYGSELVFENLDTNISD